MSLIKLIKIKVSQDYGWKTLMQDSDIRRVRDEERFTTTSGCMERNRSSRGRTFRLCQKWIFYKDKLLN